MVNGFTVDQVADMLNVSKRTVHRRVKDPKGGLSKIGETSARGWLIDPKSQALQGKESGTGEQTTTVLNPVPRYTSWKDHERRNPL